MKPNTDKIKLWDDLIESPHQEFYDSAVWEKSIRTNWPDLKTRLLPERLSFDVQNANKILKAFDDFPKIAQKQIEIVKKIIPEFEANFPIYAILAPNFDAKSVLTGKDSDSVALAVAIDSIVLENAAYEILFPHELFHAFHAKQSGFLNDGVMPNTTLVVPLWEEGLATYVSGLVNKSAPDFELLFEKAFVKLTRQDIQWLAQKFLADMKQKTLDPMPTDAFKSWFSTGKQKLKDDLPNRCGYFLGLAVVREIANSHSLTEMINWKPAEIEKPVLKALSVLKK